MSLAVVGVNHRTAPLEVRERFAHAPREVPAALARVLSAGAGGGVLLSTCNRTEFYLAEPGDAIPATVWAILTERLSEGRSASEYGYLVRDRDGVRVTLVANRTYERARAVAEELGARALTLDEAWEHFASADIVLTSTAAPHAVVTWERVAPAIQQRGGRPLCILDLAVPRDVEPAVGQLENVFLYDIDDLQAVAASAATERHHEVPAAERIVSDEVERFWAWYGGLAAVPVLKEFRGRLDDMRAAELERALKRLAHLSPEDRAQVEQFSHALLNKFLHHPTIALKQAAQAGRGYGLLESLKKLFGLERDDGA